MPERRVYVSMELDDVWWAEVVEWSPWGEVSLYRTGAHASEYAARVDAGEWLAAWEAR